LLLLDVNMPALHGDSVCRLLKARPETERVLVVLFSSLPAAELVERVKTCGADGYITKTSDPDDLVGRIRYLLGRSHNKT
jgi:DNA-binding response OmpR family regulator